MADITHTLGIDESEFVRGIHRAEDRVKSMDGSLRNSTSTIKSMQEGFQRVPGLVLGTVGAVGSLGAAIFKLAEGIDQFRNGGALLQRDLDLSKQIEFQTSSLDKYQQIETEISKQAEKDRKRIMEGEGFSTLDRVKERTMDAVAHGGVTPETFAQRLGTDLYLGTKTDAQILRLEDVETKRRGALENLNKLRRNDEDIAVERMRGQLSGERDRLPSTAEDDITARKRIEDSLFHDRLSNIRALKYQEESTKKDLIDIENDRHTRVLMQIAEERSAANRRAADERQHAIEQQERDAARRADADARVGDMLREIRLGQMRAQGMSREADIEEERARFARVRHDIEAADIPASVKAERLAELRTLEQTGLGLGSLSEPRSRTLATGLGSAAARQVLGGNGMRTVERTTSTIARDVKELVALAKRVNAPMLATFG